MASVGPRESSWRDERLERQPALWRRVLSGCWTAQRFEIGDMERRARAGWDLGEVCTCQPGQSAEHWEQSLWSRCLRPRAGLPLFRSKCHDLSPAPTQISVASGRWRIQALLGRLGGQVSFLSIGVGFRQSSRANLSDRSGCRSLRRIPNRASACPASQSGASLLRSSSEARRRWLHTSEGLTCGCCHS